MVRCRTRAPRYFKSPLHKLFIAFPELMDVETVDSIPLATTWTTPFPVDIARTRDEGIQRAHTRENDAAFIVYSDGSGEDGQVGAAAVATAADGTELVERAYLGTLDLHTVFEAELFGILLGLRIISRMREVDNAIICLDNQAAITRTEQPRAKPGQLIAAAIHDAYNALLEERPRLHLSLAWVPGHEGLDGNECVDEQAKRAAARDDTERAQIDGEPLPDSIAALRAAFKARMQREWKTRWAASEHGVRYARFDTTPPSAKVSRAYGDLKRRDAAFLTQLRTNHVALNLYLHRIGAVDSPLCVRCGEPESVDHFLLRCSRFLPQRQTLRRQLKGQVLSARSLLGSRQNQSAVVAYIHSTGRLETSRWTASPSSQSQP